MKSETKLTAILVKAGRDCNAEILNIHGGAMQTPGWPDTFIDHAVWTGFVEFKGPTTRLTPAQKRVIRQLKKRNRVPAWVVRFLLQDETFWQFRIENETGEERKTFTVDDTPHKVFCELMLRLSNIST